MHEKNRGHRLKRTTESHSYSTGTRVMATFSVPLFHRPFSRSYAFPAASSRLDASHLASLVVSTDTTFLPADNTTSLLTFGSAFISSPSLSFAIIPPKWPLLSRLRTFSSIHTTPIDGICTAPHKLGSDTGREEIRRSVAEIRIPASSKSKLFLLVAISSHEPISFRQINLSHPQVFSPTPIRWPHRLQYGFVFASAFGEMSMGPLSMRIFSLNSFHAVSAR